MVEITVEDLRKEITHDVLEKAFSRAKMLSSKKVRKLLEWNLKLDLSHKKMEIDLLILDLLDPSSCPFDCADENESIPSDQSSSSREFIPSENDEPMLSSDDAYQSKAKERSIFRRQSIEKVQSDNKKLYEKFNFSSEHAPSEVLVRKPENLKQSIEKWLNSQK